MELLPLARCFDDKDTLLALDYKAHGNNWGKSDPNTLKKVKIAQNLLRKQSKWSSISRSRQNLTDFSTSWLTLRNKMLLLIQHLRIRDSITKCTA